ncbi:MAG: 30S ribosomal protein S1 [Planctomycetota bacterium]|nr:MAG: 30S ribosomal protein S1 [Planctomycetota bacterium]
MATNELIKKLAPSPEEVELALSQAIGDADDEQIAQLYEESVKHFEPNQIINGRVLDIVGTDAVIDIGYKSEGVIPLDQWPNPAQVKVGDPVEVLLEKVEDEEGLVVLSKRKAERIRGWERVISTYGKGDTVQGRVMRKIKGGLLVDIGVPVFLPASQISIRRIPDVGEYIGQNLMCKIIKIDEDRMNIVVSRRRLIEARREEQKKDLLARLKEGDWVKGVVKNIADFGAFIDLGGLDGLLHITDMSWGRINHPSDMLSIDDEVEVVVIKVDPVQERVSLGLKQKQSSPWEDIENRYPIGSRVKGTVVNVLSYGAFVKLEEGVEGLVHVSEMSWTRRINHPSEVLSQGDEIEVMVLDINKQKQEISLGLKQVQMNPWDEVEQKYPVGTIIEGKVRNLTNYGAFVELEEGIDGLLHVSDMSWTRKVMHPSDIVKKGDTVRCMVLSVDQDKKRIALGMKQLEEDPWDTEIPAKYGPGTITSGTVTKITNFGVFVQLEDNLEGLLHVSEISDDKIDNPADVLQIGQKVDVRIIKIDPTERKIGLSMRNIERGGEQ